MRDQDRGAVPGLRRGCGRRSPPRRARRAARSARRAAPRPRRAAPRTGPAPARCAATGRRTDRCRPGSPWPAPCPGRRGRPRRRRPAPRRITSSGAPSGATLSRKRQLEADEVLEHRGQPAPPGGEVELAHVDAVDLDRARVGVVEPAQQLGQRGLAGPVAPDDGQRRAGRDGQVEVPQDRRSRCPDRRSVTSRKRISRAGMPVGRASRRWAGRRPGRSSARRRSTAATGAAAPSRAQLSPPNAIIDVPSAAWAKVTVAPSSRRPSSAAAASDQNTSRVGDQDEHHAQDEGPLAQPGRLVLQLGAAGPGARRTGRAPSRPGRTGAPPWPPAGRPRAGRRSRRPAGPSAPRRCCGRATPPLSRSSQWVASQAPASTSGAHHAIAEQHHGGGQAAQQRRPGRRR